MGFSSPLITWTSKGLYCPAGDFYIDPHRAVENAVITHAHSDHARRGSGRYYCERTGLGLLKSRIGQSIHAQGFAYGEAFVLGRAKVSFHSAGHILGSSQVRVEVNGEVWLASGDYKRCQDPSCIPFESVKCDTFITEATFGTPKYRWGKKTFGETSHGSDIFDWWMSNAAEGVNSLLFGYSLGKAQRILAELEPFAKQPILVHESIEELNIWYRREGIKLPQIRALGSLGQADLFSQGPSVYEGEMILAPPSILKMDSIARLGKFRTAFASGWMQGSSFHLPGSYDHGFVMSDHADWDDLNRTIDETGAKRVFVQHRYGVLIRHLRRRGIDAHSADMLFPDHYERLGGFALSLFPEQMREL